MHLRDLRFQIRVLSLQILISAYWILLQYIYPTDLVSRLCQIEIQIVVLMGYLD